MKQPDKVEEYKNIVRELYAARAKGKLSDDEESDFSDSLSDVWMELWEDDHAEIKAWWATERLTLDPEAK